MAVKVQVIFHSLYTHVYQLTEAVAAGAREVSDSQVLLAQVAETLPHEILEKMGAVEAKKVFAHVPVAEPHTLANADALVLGAPTRYGAAPPRCKLSSTRPAATGSRGYSSARWAVPSPPPRASTAARRRHSSKCTRSSTTKGWWLPECPITALSFGCSGV